MKIVYKGRRISGKNEVVFRNPYGDPIVLKDIGDVSQDIPSDLAYRICGIYPDVVAIFKEEPVEVPAPVAPVNKMAPQSATAPVKKVPVAKKDAEEALLPPQI